MRVASGGAAVTASGHLARNRKVVGWNPTFVLEETLFRARTDARLIDRGD
jgi:hypothetical protein